MPAGTPVQVRLPDDERDALDSYRRERSNPPSRAQAARALIRDALRQRAGCNHDAGATHSRMGVENHDRTI
jgi:hypothetical protein